MTIDFIKEELQRPSYKAFSQPSLYVSMYQEAK